MTGNLMESVRWFLTMAPTLAALFLALIFLVMLLQLRFPQERVRSLFLGRRRVGAGYVGGAALGAVTPFCSMTTIPVLAGLLRGGVPFGPTMAFLISSPLLDAVVLGVLLFLIGLKLTVAYAGVTFLASLSLGALFARVGFDADVKDLAQTEQEGRPARRASISAALSGGGSTIVGEGSAWSRAQTAVRRAWRKAWRSFVPLVPHLVLGTAIGAAVRGFLPVQWILAVAGPGQPWAIPLMAAIGLPIYINAEILLPITAALLEKGMGIGPVVALVITGLGMSASEVVLLTGFFRPRLIAALAISFFAVALAGGTLAAALGG